MPLFTLLNASNSYLIKELNIYNIDNEIIKDVFKDTFSFTDPLKPLPKELAF